MDYLSDAGYLSLKLLAKFNLMLILLFGIGLLLVSQLSRRFLEDNAREQTIQQARLMVSSARSTRDYTEEELDPLLQKTPDNAERFLPQTIPFYAATVTFNHLRKDYPDYTYKEAALNPTNPRDRAEDWEADIIHYFRDHPDQKQLIGERQTPVGKSIYLSQPIAVEEGCLQCHSSPASAPPTEVATYGSSNGFGWKLNEVIGAQIVSVPTEVPLAIAHQAFRDAAALSLDDIYRHHGGHRFRALLHRDCAAAAVGEDRRSGEQGRPEPAGVCGEGQG